MTGERKPRVVIDTSFLKNEFHFSPDSRWIAYHSDESGRREVYVASLPSFHQKRQVSRDGGANPRWRGYGRELFFLARDGTVMVADITTGAAVEASIPRRLFKTNLQGLLSMDQYDVTADGQRFLVNEVVTKVAEQLNVVLNWHADLPR